MVPFFGKVQKVRYRDQNKNPHIQNHVYWNQMEASQGRRVNGVACRWRIYCFLFPPTSSGTETILQMIELDTAEGYFL
jgi:hypothetical protein